MKILIAGASGLVGNALTAKLKEKGNSVTPLVRKPSGEGIMWNPLTGEVDTQKLEGFDAVINLAGENVSDGRWTPQKKKRIWDSRVLGTHNLVNALKKLEKPPAVLVNASAIGYYGDTGDAVAEESTPSGKGFLADVCKEWEKEAMLAQEKGVRAVTMRIGVVITPKGGALQKMLTPFKLGLGGKIGSGKQFVSWVALDDLVNAIVFCIENTGLSGPVNAVAPVPVTNYQMTKALGAALRRPTIFPLPTFFARVLFGEMADELLLGSTRVRPAKLEDAGFHFKYSELSQALEAMVGS